MIEEERYNPITIPLMKATNTYIILDFEVNRTNSWGTQARGEGWAIGVLAAPFPSFTVQQVCRGRIPCGN